MAAVVTQPDKPKGRGKEMQMTPVKIQALEYKIPVYQPVKVRDESFVKVLREMEADVFVVIAFGQILPKDVLDLPRLWLRQHPCIPAAQVQGSGSHPVVRHRR